MDINFEVCNQIIRLKPEQKPLKLADKSNNYLKLFFDFKTEDWSNEWNYCLLRNVDQETYQFTITDEGVTVPSVVLKGKYFYISVYGTNPDNTRITSNVLKLKLVDSQYSNIISDVSGDTDVFVDLWNSIYDIREVLVTKVDDIIIEDRMIKAFSNGDLLFTQCLDNTHNHSSSEVLDFGERTSVEVKQAFRLLNNYIRTN